MGGASSCKLGCDSFCKTNICSFGQGDCDNDDECWGNLICGTNNCGGEAGQYDLLDDCCKTRPLSRRGNTAGGNNSIGPEVIGLASALGVVALLMIGLVCFLLKLRRRRALESADKAKLVRNDNAHTYNTTTVASTSELRQEAA